MKTKKYNEMSMSELDKELAGVAGSLQKSRFAMAGSRPKDVKHDAKLRKDIARILTAKRLNKNK